MNENEKMMNEGADRVLVICDVRNIRELLNNNYGGLEIDYRSLFDKVIGDRECCGIVAFDGLVPNHIGRDKEWKFHEELRKNGIELELIEQSNGCGKQDGVDVAIASKPHFLPTREVAIPSSWSPGTVTSFLS